MKKIRKILLFVGLLFVFSGCQKTPCVCPENNVDITEIFIGISDELSTLYEEKVKETVSIFAYGGISSSTGSGFVYKEVGDYAYILTNNHVVSSSSSVEVMYHNKVRQAATVVKSNIIEDIAILRVSKNANYLVSQLGDSSSLKRGEMVFAIGSPFGFDFAGTITSGVVSGLNIYVEDKNAYMIQTDTALNRGNSGGPLYNLSGEVIGINTLKFINAPGDPNESIQSFNFAIPIDFARLVESCLFSEVGEYNKPTIGIKDNDLKAIAQYSLSQKIGAEIAEDVFLGLHIIDVTEGTNADFAGITENRILTKINEVEVRTKNDFYGELYKHLSGSIVTIETVDLSGGSLATHEVTLG